MSNDFEADREVFHAHLDECQRCRERPFNLCPQGAKLLKTCAERLRYVPASEFRKTTTIGKTR